MGKSGFRISHVVPPAWFFKLRDMGRSTNEKLHAPAGTKATAPRPINLARPNYYKLASSRSQGLQGHGNSPVKYGIRLTKKLEEDEEAQIRIVSRRSKFKGQKSPGPAISSTLINSGVSAGCSCKATVGSRWSGIRSHVFVERRSNPGRRHHVPKKNSHDLLELEKLGSAHFVWDSPTGKFQETGRENLEVINSVEKRIRRPSYIKSKKYLTGLPAYEVISVDDRGITEHSGDSDSAPLEKADPSVKMGKESQQMVRGAVPFTKRDAGNSNAMKCSALCCSCRLSISSVEAERDAEESLWDVAFWSEDDEFAEAREEIHVPFLSTKSKNSDYNNRLLLDMNLRFSPARDAKESATLVRPGDAISTHAQAQVKLSEMIKARGPKIDSRRMNSDADHYFSENEKDVRNCNDCKGMPEPKLAAVSYESDPEITWEDSNYYNSLSASRYDSRKSDGVSGKDQVTNYEEIPLVISDDGGERKSEKSVKQISIKSRPQSSATKVASTHANRKILDCNGRSRKIVHNDGVEAVKGKRERMPASAAQNANLKQKSHHRKQKECVAVADDVAVTDAQRKISESFAIVKCSYDPWKDFRDSMVEMIVENEIHDSRDLQELLHSYVSLNSDEYHHIILEVFEQVTSDLSNMISAV